MATLHPPHRPHAATDDETLMARVAAGDRVAFESLHARHHRLAVHVAHGVLGAGHSSVEDAVQEAFIRAWVGSRRFDPARGSVRTWLAWLVRNAAIDAGRRERTDRKRRERAELLAERPAEIEPTLADLVRAERARRVRAAVGRLPRDQGRVLGLAYYLDLSQARIADELGCPLGTVKGRSRLGLARLRTLLDEVA